MGYAGGVAASGRRPRRALKLCGEAGADLKLISDELLANAIARQARDLFLEKGYARTAMEDIATRCHISKRTLYRLFSAKSKSSARSSTITTKA